MLACHAGQDLASFHSAHFAAASSCSVEADSDSMASCMRWFFIPSGGRSRRLSFQPLRRRRAKSWSKSAHAQCAALICTSSMANCRSPNCPSCRGTRSLASSPPRALASSASSPATESAFPGWGGLAARVSIAARAVRTSATRRALPATPLMAATPNTPLPTSDIVFPYRVLTPTPRPLPCSAPD
jgi:hypothetical protein